MSERRASDMKQYRTFKKQNIRYWVISNARRMQRCCRSARLILITPNPLQGLLSGSFNITRDYAFAPLSVLRFANAEPLRIIARYIKCPAVFPQPPLGAKNIRCFAPFSNLLPPPIVLPSRLQPLRVFRHAWSSQPPKSRLVVPQICLSCAPEFLPLAS